MEADYCARHANPQAVHRMMLLPQKLWLDGEYVQNPTFWGDLRLMAVTFLLAFTPSKFRAVGQRSRAMEVLHCGRAGQFVLDLIIYTGAAWLAYRLRYEAGFPVLYRRQMWLFIIFIPPVRVMVNWRRGVYDLMWRYVNLVDASFIAVALVPVTMVLLLFRLWLPLSSWQAVLFQVPLSVTVLEYLMALIAGVGLRILRQRLYVLRHHYQPLPEASHRVLILGAGLLGLRAAIDMRQYPHMNLVGFLDDDPTKQRRLVAGCRVLGSSESLQVLGARHKISDLIICAKSIEPHKIVTLDRHCAALGIKLHFLPSLDRLLRTERYLSPSAFPPSVFGGYRAPLTPVTSPLGAGRLISFRPPHPLSTSPKRERGDGAVKFSAG
jgi:hypothetical protein